MEQTPKTDILYRGMQGALDAHHKDRLSWKGLLAFLKWQMAVADDNAVTTFLAEVQEDQHIDVDLKDEVTRAYTENVQHWVFPEEPELSKAVPDAIECTFPELIQSAYTAAGGLRHVRGMLVGVRTRLDVRRSYAAIGQALHLVPCL